MKPALWMVGSAVLSWLVVAAIPDVDSDREVLLGMLAPLAGAVGTWVLVARTYPSQPERLTSLMVAAFGGKLVFFGAYVTVMQGAGAQAAALRHQLHDLLHRVAHVRSAVFAAFVRARNAGPVIASQF